MPCNISLLSFHVRIRKSSSPDALSQILMIPNSKPASREYPKHSSQLGIKGLLGIEYPTANSKLLANFTHFIFYRFDLAPRKLLKSQVKVFLEFLFLKQMLNHIIRPINEI